MRGFVFLLLPVVAATGPRSPASADWRENVRAFAEAHLQHTAWGPAHARRDYETTLALARAQGTVVDTDALYAAAYLHDMGGLPPFALPGVDHGDRSAQLVDSMLRDAGFPMEKVELVKEIAHAIDVIRHHMLEMPGRLQTEAAKREGQRRVLEMQRFLDDLKGETDSLGAL